MEIKRIDHYSIRTLDVEASRKFYTEIIGLKVGPRPPFNFPGLWLYSGEPPADLDHAEGNYGMVHDGPKNVDVNDSASPSTSAPSRVPQIEPMSRAFRRCRISVRRLNL